MHYHCTVNYKPPRDKLHGNHNQQQLTEKQLPTRPSLDCHDCTSLTPAEHASFHSEVNFAVHYGCISLEGINSARPKDPGYRYLVECKTRSRQSRLIVNSWRMNWPLRSPFPSVLYGILVTIAHFIPRGASGGKNEKDDGRREFELDAWQIRFFNLQAPSTFGPFRRSPPRIELSVQISILTANLPANSPLFRRPAAHAASSFLHQRPPFSIPDLPRSASFSLCPIDLCLTRTSCVYASLLCTPNILTRGIFMASFRFGDCGRETDLWEIFNVDLV